MSTATLTISEAASLHDGDSSRRQKSADSAIERHVDGTKSSGSDLEHSALVVEQRDPSRLDDGESRRREEAEAAERRMLRAIRKGDERAFSRLVHAYQDRVYGICLRMLRRPEEAEDVAQEVFVSLHRALGNFRGQSKLSTWIYKITRNHCLNRLKYLERRHEDAKVGLESAAGHEPVGVDTPPPPDQHLEGVELQAVLEQALHELSEEQRMLVILRDIDGLSYEEIVDVCDLPLGTVKSRLHRARLTLAETLRRWREGKEVEDRPRDSTKKMGIGAKR